MTKSILPIEENQDLHGGASDKTPPSESKSLISPGLIDRGAPDKSPPHTVAEESLSNKMTKSKIQREENKDLHDGAPDKSPPSESRSLISPGLIERGAQDKSPPHIAAEEYLSNKIQREENKGLHDGAPDKPQHSESRSLISPGLIERGA